MTQHGLTDEEWLELALPLCGRVSPLYRWKWNVHHNGKWHLVTAILDRDGNASDVRVEVAE